MKAPKRPVNPKNPNKLTPRRSSLRSVSVGPLTQTQTPYLDGIPGTLAAFQ